MRPQHAHLWTGEVSHTRFRPRRHHLRYPILSVSAPLEGGDEPALRLRIFGLPLLSLDPRDHGQGDQRLRDWVITQLVKAGHDGPVGRIEILTAPRVFGLVFNPITSFLCHDPDDRLCGAVFQVGNFHAGRGVYAFPVEPDSGASARFGCDKSFFVSPFNPVDGQYRFRLSRTDGRYRLAIQYLRAGEPVMSAVHTARARPLTRRGVLAQAPLSLLNTAVIVGGILFEALKLRLKGLALHSPRAGTPDTIPWRK